MVKAPGANALDNADLDYKNLRPGVRGGVLQLINLCSVTVVPGLSYLKALKKIFTTETPRHRDSRLLRVLP